MIFNNEQVDLEQLPRLDTVNFNKLAPAYKKTEYLSTGILFAILLVFTIAMYFNASPKLGNYRLIIPFIWLSLFALSMFMVHKKYQVAGYTIREHDVVSKQGVWWQTVTTIPFNRIQHCEISQGPIQNAFNLATLRIFTAGGSSSDLAIDGMEQEEAKRVKAFITGKIGSPSEEINLPQDIKPTAPTDSENE